MQRCRWLVIGFIACGLLSAGLLPTLDAGGKDKKVVGKKEAPIVPPKKGTSETIKLFNGKDLEGWEGATKYFSAR